MAYLPPDDAFVALDVRCRYELRLLVSTAGQAGSSGKIMIDSIVLAPAIKLTDAWFLALEGKFCLRNLQYSFLLHDRQYAVSHKTYISEPAKQIEYEGCFFDYMKLSTKVAALAPTVCRSFMRTVGTEMEGQALGTYINL